MIFLPFVIPAYIYRKPLGLWLNANGNSEVLRPRGLR
jgi:hypothetical protein